MTDDGSASRKGVSRGDPFVRDLIEVATTGDLSDLSQGSSPWPGDGLEPEIDYRNGDLYLSKFNALALEHWARISERSNRLTSFGYAKLTGKRVNALGLTNARGEVTLNSAYFGTAPTRRRHLEAAKLGLVHVIDDVPEYTGILTTLHETAHVESAGGTAFDVEFLPDFFEMDQRAAWQRAVDQGTLTSAAFAIYGDLLRPKVRKRWANEKFGEHPAVVADPRLRLLNDRVAAAFVSAYGSGDKGELGPEARAKFTVAGELADGATRAIAALYPSYDAFLAAAAEFRATPSTCERTSTPGRGFEQTREDAARKSPPTGPIRCSNTGARSRRIWPRRPTN
ncbi:hypothetical protein ACIRL2_30355 [Embleya sp. NPDC127516]|uniref:hypothetical protein n=1 Tax=Embleya sp. NPDC127516 TaxID=3363990 RepID=UPI003828D0AC